MTIRTACPALCFALCVHCCFFGCRSGAGDNARGIRAATETPSHQFVRVTGLRMRAQPERTAPVISTFRLWEVVTLMEKTNRVDTIDGITSPWYRVKDWKGAAGFAFGGYLTDLPFRIGPGIPADRARLLEALNPSYNNDVLMSNIEAESRALAYRNRSDGVEIKVAEGRSILVSDSEAKLEYVTHLEAVRFHVVRKAGWEEMPYLLVNQDTGDKYGAREVPLPSPGGRYLAVISTGGHVQGQTSELFIFKNEKGRLSREWEGDMGWCGIFDARWTGETSLKMTWKGTDPAKTFDRNDPGRIVYLKKDSSDWRASWKISE